MLIQPYLSFDGRCDEAMEFYRGALGAELTALMRFKESPDPAMHPPGLEESDSLACAHLRSQGATRRRKA